MTNPDPKAVVVVLLWVGVTAYLLGHSRGFRQAMAISQRLTHSPGTRCSS